MAPAGRPRRGRGLSGGGGAGIVEPMSDRFDIGGGGGARESRVEVAERPGLHQGWESRPSPTTMDDLDPELIDRARQGAGLAAVGTEEYLLRRDLADRGGARLALRRAAELLFARRGPGHPNASVHPSASVRIFRVIGMERRFGFEGNVEEHPPIEGSLPAVLGEARRVVEGLVRRPSRLMGARFQEMPEYPDFAWQEALHNAVAHRDYAIQETGTELWMYQDRLEVVSPGGLPEGVGLDGVLRPEGFRAPRNPRIARVLRDLGHVRDAAGGIPRMFAEMSDAFLRPPEFTVRAQRVTVVLRNALVVTRNDRRFLAALTSADLSREEFRAILAAARSGRVDRAHVRSAMGLETLAAGELLRGLRDRGLLQRHGHGAGSHYTLAGTLAERVGVGSATGQPERR